MAVADEGGEKATPSTAIAVRPPARVVALRRIRGHFRLPGGKVNWKRVEAVVLRLLGLVWLVAAVLVWAELVGAVPTPAGAAFADAPLVWQLRTAAFAIVYPVAAVGLWMLSAWGIVVFVASIVGQVAFQVATSYRFGVDPLMIAANLACLVGWAALAIHVWRNPQIEKR